MKRSFTIKKNEMNWINIQALSFYYIEKNPFPDIIGNYYNLINSKFITFEKKKGGNTFSILIFFDFKVSIMENWESKNGKSRLSESNR